MHHIPQMPIPNGNISADVQQMLSFQTNQMYSMYDMPTFAPFQKPQVTTTLFPGEAGGVAIYSSRDILFACLKSLEYLIHLSQPITPAESCVGFVPYKESAIQQCFQAPSTIPSPVFCQPICVLMSYIVASSTLIAFERVNSEQSMQVYRIIKECIYPTMMQITQVWPIADYYGRKLQTLLADYEGYHHNI
jgi:hypothetical protein